MIEETKDGIKLYLLIQPKSSKNEIIGPHNGALKIKIKAPPIDGRANEELVEFLSDILGLAKRNITVAKGETGRNKTVIIQSLSIAEIKNKLKL